MAVCGETLPGGRKQLELQMSKTEYRLNTVLNKRCLAGYKPRENEGLRQVKVQIVLELVLSLGMSF